MFWVVVALLYFVLAAVAPSILGLFVNRARPDFGTLSLSLRIVFVVIALICLAATSYVHVESDEIAVLNKIYGTTSLPGEHIIATNGEKGPQAEILTPGWHPWFLVNVIYQVENKKVVSIPSGKYGFLNAKDGAPLRPDQFLADAFPAGHELDMLDADYFLTHGGQRGPQTTILTPGNYRLNTYLWDLSIYNAVDVAEGFVGVVKSNVINSVHFGNLNADKPASCQQKMVSTNASGEAVAAREAKTDEGKLTAILVPVGCIGIWEKALQPGRYYANEAAYKITMMSTRVQTWEFKGGYKKRYIDLSLDQAGNLTQSPRSEDRPVPPGSADPAITPFVEGWLVPLELRVLAQVTPDNAPFVVASVGGLPEIENNIMVPTIRSIVRNVVGAQGRHVLDLADNRAELEHAVEDAIRPEGLRAGIVIKEVKVRRSGITARAAGFAVAPAIGRSASGHLPAGTKGADATDRNRKGPCDGRAAAPARRSGDRRSGRRAEQKRGEAARRGPEARTRGDCSRTTGASGRARAGPGVDDHPCPAAAQDHTGKAGGGLADRKAGSTNRRVDRWPRHRARQRRGGPWRTAQQRRRRGAGTDRAIHKKMRA